MKRYSGKDVLLMIFDLLQVPYKDYVDECFNIIEIDKGNKVYSFYLNEYGKLYRITEISGFIEPTMKILFDENLGIIESEKEE